MTHWRGSILFSGLIALLVSFHSSATPAPDDVISAFRSAGLEAENPTPMGPKDFGLAPYVCRGTRFLIPSLGEDSGGRVLSCPSTGDRDAIAAYYVGLGKRSAALFSWVFVKGNVVVQINGDLDEALARKYESAIPSGLERIGDAPKRLLGADDVALTERLVGRWEGTTQNADGSRAVISFELTSNKTFSGSVKAKGKVVWVYSGAWDVVDGKLRWSYLSSTPPLAEVPKVDEDEITELSEELLVLLPRDADTPDAYVRQE